MRGRTWSSARRTSPAPSRTTSWCRRRWWRSQPKVAQKIVNAWYDTLAYIDANPDKALKIMADKAEFSTADYQDLASGTKIFTVDEAIAAFQPGDTVTSLEYTAGSDQPVPGEVGPHQEAGVAQGPVRTAVHRGLRRRPSVVVTTTSATAQSTRPSRGTREGPSAARAASSAGRHPDRHAHRARGARDRRAVRVLVARRRRAGEDASSSPTRPTRSADSRPTGTAVTSGPTSGRAACAS